MKSVWRLVFCCLWKLRCLNFQTLPAFVRAVPLVLWVCCSHTISWHSHHFCFVIGNHWALPWGSPALSYVIMTSVVLSFSWFFFRLVASFLPWLFPRCSCLQRLGLLGCGFACCLWNCIPFIAVAVYCFVASFINKFHLSETSDPYLNLPEWLHQLTYFPDISEVKYSHLTLLSFPCSSQFAPPPFFFQGKHPYCSLCDLIQRIKSPLWLLHFPCHS